MSSEAENALPGVECATGDAAAALARILDSRTFSSAPRSRDFLAFIGTETLAGRGDRLKERTIAVRALSRGPDFQGQSDAAVRVQATRLRETLARYYAGEGRTDPVRIQIPKGRYVPVFVQATEARTLPWTRGPGLLVTHFSGAPDEGGGCYGPMLTDHLLQALAGHRELTLYGPATLAVAETEAAKRRSLKAEGTDYVLEGSVWVSAGVARVAFRLVELAEARLVLVRVVERTLGDEPLPVVLDDLACRIAAQVGDCRGALHRDAERRPGASAAYGAMTAYFAYVESNTTAAARTALARLTEALSAEPSNPILLTMAAAMEVRLSEVTPGPHGAALLDRAEQHAQAALNLDPLYAPAHMVLARVALAHDLPQLCHAEARRTAELAPANPSVLYTVGFLLAHHGDWNEAAALMRRGMELSPMLPSFCRTVLAIATVLHGDFAEALADVAEMPDPYEFWQPTVRALALAGLGKLEHARGELARALALEPDLLHVLERQEYLTEAERRTLVDGIVALAEGGPATRLA